MKRTLLSATILCLSFKANANFIETNAKYAVVMDYESGQVLFEKNAHEKAEPSSMTKMMTAYLIFEGLKEGRFKLEDNFHVSTNAWSKEGSRTFLPNEQPAKLEDLIKGMIIQSGNDATVAIAEGVMGSEENFARLMTEKAKEIGMHESEFKNSTGLPQEGHLASVYDMAILGKRLISDFPQYYGYFAEKEFTYNKIRQYNRNTLLYREGTGVDGIKTGHAEKAGYSITASAKKGDRRIIVSVNGLPSESERIKAASELLTYGFNAFSNVKLATQGEVIGSVKVLNASNPEVKVVAPENYIVSVPNQIASKVTTKVVAKENLQAPIKKGTVVAKLVVEGLPEGTTIEKDLVANADYDEAPFYQKWYRKFFG